MRLSDLFATALLGLRANRVRALLTTLGIIIGVATVISMVSIIEGMNRYTYQVLGAIGSNTIHVQKWAWTIRMGPMSREEMRELARRPDLTLDDARAIERLPSVERAVAVRSQWSQTVRFRSEELEVQSFVGAEPGYVEVSGLEIERGRDITEQDQQYRRQVCVIGQYVVDQLLKEVADPLGREILIGNRRFMVVGVLKKKGEFLGTNLDNIVIIPLSTMEKFFPPRGEFRVFRSLSILVQAKEGRMEEALHEIEELLRARRGLRFDQENNFGLNTQQVLLEAYRKLTSGIFLAMIAIASLALLVGGIGIMNIMLVSVRERTREIGLRMAVGAKRREILLQFLLESMVLTAVGGLLGVFLGFGIAKLVDVLTPLPSAMPLWSVVLGVGFSALVGLFFGIHPASVAARMDPIEALRYE